MTQEEKQLLLLDLSARLTCGVILHVEGFVGGNYLCGDSKLIGIHNGVIHVENLSAYGNYVGLPLAIDTKPYLRPMSSMTEEEIKEFASIRFFKTYPNGIIKKFVKIENHYDNGTLNAAIKYKQDDNETSSISNFFFIIRQNECFYLEEIDWLNKNMFDYRGLIPMGLALEALEEMYNTKEK